MIYKSHISNNFINTICLTPSMFIELHIEGLDAPQVVPIEKASSVSKELEKRGKNFRLGRTIH